MDKKFFMFDIDDEIKQIKSENENMQKTQNSINSSEKICKNDEKVNIFVNNHIKSKASSSYEKQTGLKQQREIKSNIREISDFVNFDFRAKEKELEKLIDIHQNINLSTIQITDEEVEKVIEKAQIGVIFY